MQNITFVQAWRKFGLEAEQVMPAWYNEEARIVSKAFCVDGLAYKAGYYVEDFKTVQSKMAELEKSKTLTVRNLLAN